jgi:hypothetical protein
MALISCQECNESVSTEAVACPHCGAPQRRSAPPPSPVQPLPIQTDETTIYSDSVVAVTSTRVIIGGTTYALRNVTSVRMAFTPPQVARAIALLVFGLLVLLATFMPFNDAKAPPGVYIIAGAMIGGAILWMTTAKTRFHVSLSTTSRELHVLTSRNKVYIQRIVQSINSAIARQR